jgi:hypothetical protein
MALGTFREHLQARVYAGCLDLYRPMRVLDPIPLKDRVVHRAYALVPELADRIQLRCRPNAHVKHQLRS